MSAPIYDRLKEYAQKDVYPFHMPGHKQGRGLDITEGFTLDITEIPGFDNLHQPEGIIKQAQELCAQTWGADRSYFLVNGASGGLIAAVMACCRPDEKILVARNCHRSVYSGLVLSGAAPAYCMPDILHQWGIFGGLSLEEIQRGVKENPDAKAIVITSPTYEGFVPDVEAIGKIAHAHGMALIVDEAHGAHMKFHSYFPRPALELGADLVVQSFHKTLLTPNQTGVLHVKGNRISLERLESALSMIQTTSPSYLFLAAIDRCRQRIQEEGEALFHAYVERLVRFREETADLRTFTMLDRSMVGKGHIFDVDLGKLVITLRSEKTGYWLEEVLRDRFRIQLELSKERHCIAMTSLADSQEGFMRLAEALHALDRETPFAEETKESMVPLPEAGEMVVLPRQGVNEPKIERPLSQCLGKIAGEFIIAYPPGIPLVVPGERIQADLLEYIHLCRSGHGGRLWMNDPTMMSIQVLERQDGL